MDIKEYVKQPNNGLLYDLGLLPEECKTHQRMLTSKVIKELQRQNVDLNNKLEALKTLVPDEMKVK